MYLIFFNACLCSAGTCNCSLVFRIPIRDLYPHTSKAELAVAEANLRRYVALVVRVYDRLKAEGKS